jgi:hypothetical protein
MAQQPQCTNRGERRRDSGEAKAGGRAGGRAGDNIINVLGISQAVSRCNRVAMCKVSIIVVAATMQVASVTRCKGCRVAKIINTTMSAAATKIPNPHLRTHHILHDMCYKHHMISQ